MRTRPARSWLDGLMAAAVLGCGARSELRTWSVSAAEGDARDATCGRDSDSPVITLQRFSWSSRQPPLTMGPIEERACFLTRIGGRFDSAQDGVQIVAEAGQWLLTGTTASAGFVEAGAACVAATDVTAEAQWQQGQEPIVMSSATTHACFLTGAFGRFEGGGEILSLARSDGNWRLSGSSLQPTLGGSARCLRMASTSDSFGMQFDTPSPLPSRAEQDGVCYLTVLCGDLGGDDDRVEIAWNGSAWELRRQVGGTRSLRASAACFGRHAGADGLPDGPDE